jgi:hypothetical protein
VRIEKTAKSAGIESEPRTPFGGADRKVEIVLGQHGGLRPAWRPGYGCRQRQNEVTTSQPDGRNQRV